MHDLIAFLYIYICRQIEVDSKFLETQHIMDYSLLLGVHYRAPPHLRSLLTYNRTDGLGSVAEEGRNYEYFYWQYRLDSSIHLM